MLQRAMPPLMEPDPGSDLPHIAVSVSKQLLQPGIAGCKALTRSINHLFTGDARPIEHVSIPYGELPYELPLGPPVSFAKRVNGVDLSQVVRSTICEASSFSSAEKTFFLEIRKGLIQESRDVLSEAKEMPTLGNIDSAKLPGPLVDVLEHVTVNCLKVRRIELSRDRPNS